MDHPVYPTLAQKIADEIHRKIMRGEYRPNQQLKALDLAREYGISQTTVREALQILERADLVRKVARRGVYVRHLTIDEIEVIWEIKARLWGLAIRRFTEVCTDEERARIAALFDKMIRAIDQNQHDQVFACNFELADFVLLHCKSEKLSAMLNGIEMQVKRYRFQSSQFEENLRATRDCFVELKRAVLERDGAGAEEHMKRFIFMDRDTLVAHWDSLN